MTEEQLPYHENKSTMEKLKGVLHHYIGCEVLYKGEIHFLCGVSLPYKTNDKMLPTFSVRPNKKGFRSIIYSLENFDEIKLLLRPLSDMSKQEQGKHSELWKAENFPFPNGAEHRWAAYIDWLLKLRFDLFGLIESGHALDKNKIKANPQ